MSYDETQELAVMRKEECVCARAHIQVKTAVTALQARVYRENKRYKSVTHPLQIVIDPLQIERLRGCRCLCGGREAGSLGGVYFWNSRKNAVLEWW